MPRAARPSVRDDAARVAEYAVDLLCRHGKLSGPKIRQLLVAEGGVRPADADAAFAVAKQALDTHPHVTTQARSYVWSEPAEPLAAEDDLGLVGEALRSLIHGGRLALAKRQELAEPVWAALRTSASPAEAERPQAELARTQAELARTQADLVHGRAELERTRAELERLRAEFERVRAALAEVTAGLTSRDRPVAPTSDAEASTDRRSAELRQAQERQIKIDAVRALAELAMEVEELTINEVEAQVLVHRVRARVRKEGLEPIDRAGEETTFDRNRHKPIGGGICDGEPVSVVRPGYTWRAPGEDVLIGKAIVEE